MWWDVCVCVWWEAGARRMQSLQQLVLELALDRVAVLDNDLIEVFFGHFERLVHRLAINELGYELQRELLDGYPFDVFSQVIVNVSLALLQHRLGGSFAGVFRFGGLQLELDRVLEVKRDDVIEFLLRGKRVLCGVRLFWGLVLRVTELRARALFLVYFLENAPEQLRVLHSLGER